MKYKFNLFIKDHIWIFIFYTVEFAFIYIGLKYLSEEFTNVLYMGFLGLFILLCFLGIRYYRTRELYHALEEPKVNIEDSILIDPKSSLSQAYSDSQKHYRTSYLNEINSLKLERKKFEVMSNRWVHQMKTPISVIQLISQNHKLEDDYQRITYETERLNHQLVQLLNIYKIGSMEHDFHIEKTSLKDLAKHAVNDLKTLFLQKSIYPKIQMEENPYVYTDVMWMEFVLYQLLSNAIKYSEEEGNITVSAEYKNNTVNLFVIDEGLGIDNSDLPRIYNLFFTGSNGKSKGESTGMGLYMVKEVLDYLGHGIKVSSVKGKGTMFTITFQGER